MGCCQGVVNTRLLRNRKEAKRATNRYSAIALTEQVEYDQVQGQDSIRHDAKQRIYKGYVPNVETILEIKENDDLQPDDAKTSIENEFNSLDAKSQGVINLHDCTRQVKQTIVYVPMAHQVLPTFLSLVVQHAKPSLTSPSTYDDTAQKAFDFLRDCANTSRYSKTFQVSEWLGDADRQECDKNRVSGRNCSILQQDYIFWIKQKRLEHRRVYAINLHTFTEAENSWGTIEQDQDNAGFSDLVILDNCLERNKFLASSISLRNFLNERKFYVSIFKNTSTVNDVDGETLKQTVERALVWEFNEALDDDKLNKLCQSIVEWLSLEVLNRNKDMIV